MPYCPTCRSEYVEGTEVCEDCGAKLVAELPPKKEPTPKHQDLKDVWHAQGEMEAQMIRALLESNNVESMLSGEAVRLTHGLTLNGLAVVKILVREHDARRACDIIASLDDMKQCPRCGHPAHELDAACHYCDFEYGKPQE